MSHTSDRVEFPSNGDTASGYLAVPESGVGPGLLLVQEWWGLDSGLIEMADRFAAEGFTVLAPDLYRGELAGHTEMDRAGELMSKMPPERAAKDMSGAVDYLAASDHVSGAGPDAKIGVVGFCMGGMLSFHIAADRPDRVAAVVPFYGFPQGDGQPDYSAIAAPIRAHLAEHDDFFAPGPARELEARLKDLGKDVEFTIYPGSGHAFMAPHNALGTLDEDLYREVWPKVIDFLHAQLG